MKETQHGTNDTFNVSASQCRICGRRLTDPESVRLGIGPVCRGRGYGDDSSAQNTDNITDHFIDEPLNPNGLVLRRDESGVWTNIPHVVVHHSPTGFEWGYGGSGPADLALNICEILLHIRCYDGPKTKCYDGECFELAFEMHQEFKWRVIANIPRDGEQRIPYQSLLETFNKIYDDRYGNKP